MNNRRKTSLITDDGLSVYDLDVNASELCVVAGPHGCDVMSIDPDDLPSGFRWIENEEWERLNEQYADFLSDPES
jgi:hypothetical protein